MIIPVPGAPSSEYRCLMKAQLSQILMFPPKELPYLVIPLRASPWKYMPNVLRRLVAQNVARTVPMTHPPLVTTGPQTFAYSPPFTLVHHSIGLNALFCTQQRTNQIKKEKIWTFLHSHTPSMYLLCAKSRRNAKRNVFM